MLRRPRVSASLVLAASLLASCDSSTSHEDPTLEPLALTDGHWHAEGQRILDSAGREVILRGFNTGGRSKMPPYLPFDYADGQDVAALADAFFAKVEALGANAVRLSFEWEALEPTQGTYDATYLARYRAMLDAAAAHHIGVLVDNHQDGYASPFCGNGFPRWTLGSIPYGAPHYDCGFPNWSFPAQDPTSVVSQAYDRFNANQGGIKDAMKAALTHLVGAVKDHPAFGAVDLLNEPGAGTTPTATFDTVTLPALYTGLAAAVRAADPNAMVFGHHRIGDGIRRLSDVVLPSIPNYGYSPHYYEPLLFLGVPTYDLEQVRGDFATALKPADDRGVPAFLGETGVPNGNDGRGDYFDDLLDFQDEGLRSCFVWEASQSADLWNSEDFSAIDPFGNETPGSDALVRAYPRAVAGHIERISYERTTHHFELEVSAARAEVSEIELPHRWYGDHPNVRTTGSARYRYFPERHLLVVHADVGSSYSVVVEP